MIRFHITNNSQLLQIVSFPRSPHPNPVYISPLPYTCYVPRPSHYSPLHHPNNIWLAVQIIKLFITQFSQLSCYFVPLTPMSGRSLVHVITRMSRRHDMYCSTQFHNNAIIIRRRWRTKLRGRICERHSEKSQHVHHKSAWNDMGSKPRKPHTTARTASITQQNVPRISSIINTHRKSLLSTRCGLLEDTLKFAELWNLALPTLRTIK